ncbi:MAG TPA: diacylglycerol kinase family protein [Candidatus Dormibacteraeota bacterium]|nr:diacylglycerol kinase family protein [Candidatus Dormibacteraeota bacterium]
MPVIGDLARTNPAVIFVNGRAGQGKTERILPEMRALVTRRHWPIEFQLTHTTEDLEKCVHQTIEGGSRVLLTMGGDGSFHALINATAGINAAGGVILGVIPSGGGNDFAASLGLPRDPFMALERIVYAGPRRVDLALAKTADGRDRYYAGGAGVGLDAEAAMLADRKYRHLPSRLRYVTAALHAFSRFAAIRVKVEFPDGDHAEVNTEVLLASVMNTATYGAGLRLAPEARIDDGLLDVVLLKPLEVVRIAALLPRLLCTGELRTGGITRRRTPRVRITTDRPCMFHGDGEVIGPAPVEVEAIAGAVQVLAPVQG